MEVKHAKLLALTAALRDEANVRKLIKDARILLEEEKKHAETVQSAEGNICLLCITNIIVCIFSFGYMVMWLVCTSFLLDIVFKTQGFSPTNSEIDQPYPWYPCCIWNTTLSIPYYIEDLPGEDNQITCVSRDERTKFTSCAPRSYCSLDDEYLCERERCFP